MKDNKLKKYRVYYGLTYNEPEEIEAVSEMDAQEEVYEMIMDNIGFYIDCVAEEIEDDEEEDI